MVMQCVRKLGVGSKAAAWLVLGVGLLLGDTAQAQCSQWLTPGIPGLSVGTGGLPALPTLPDGAQLYPGVVAGAPDGSVVVTAGTDPAFSFSGVRRQWVLRGTASGWTPLSTRPDLGVALEGTSPVAVQNLEVLPNGNVVVVMPARFDLVPGGFRDYHVLMWDGTQWQPLGNGFVPRTPTASFGPFGAVLAVHPQTGELYVGGNILALRNADGSAGSPAVIARWTGNAWSVEATPTDVPDNGRVVSLDFTPEGRLMFLTAERVGPSGEAVPPSMFVRGATWTQLPGLGLNSVLQGSLDQLTMQDPLLVANGYVYVCGTTTVDGVVRATIRKYDGAWSTVYRSTDTSVAFNDMAALPGGMIVFQENRTVSASTLPSRLMGLLPDGTTRELGLSGTLTDLNFAYEVFSMSVLNNGRLALVGSFSANSVAPGSAANVALYETGLAPVVGVESLQPVTVSTGQTVTLTAMPWTGLAESVTGGISYQWLRVVGAASPGGVVSGATGVITSTQPITLTIDNAQPGDSGAYELRLRTACQTITYQTSVTVQGQPGCDDIDFNNNDVFPEEQDVIDFFTVLAGGTCP